MPGRDAVSRDIPDWISIRVIFRRKGKKHFLGGWIKTMARSQTVIYRQLYREYVMHRTAFQHTAVLSGSRVEDGTIPIVIVQQRGGGSESVVRFVVEYNWR
jgi:hypothetical protein